MQSVNAGRLLLSLSAPYSCVSSVYFRFGRPYCYFRFSVADAITSGTFFELAIVENSRIVVGISTLSILVPDIQVFPVWATILLFLVVGRCCKTVNIGSIGFLAMENAYIDTKINILYSLLKELWAFSENSVNSVFGVMLTFVYYCEC